MAANYFQNKKIWITGASSGIGKAMAEELAKLGAKLVISGRRKEALMQLAKELLVFGAQQVEVLPFDLEQEAERQNALAEMQKIWSAPDILILSGGLSQRSLIRDTELKVYRRLMEVDYLANVELTKAFMDPDKYQ